MTSHKITICGTPQVGKRTLLTAIGQLTGFGHVNRPSETEPNAYLELPYQGAVLQFAAGCGSYLNPESMARKVLVQASAVIYVLSPAYPDGDRAHLDDDEHRYYFDVYVRQAQSLGVGWEHIPWLVVLNKTDLAPSFPTEAALFPDAILRNHVRCIASEGVGVSDVWKRLLELLHLPISS